MEDMIWSITQRIGAIYFKEGRFEGYMPTVNEIRSFPFNEEGLEQVRETRDGKNWTVVYLIHDDENLYIGETTSVATRMSQHLKNQEKKQLEVIEIVFDGKYNKSVVLDYEQRLIKYCSVDIRFKNILNKNKGQQAAHDYFNRKFYRNQFGVLWKQLRDNGLVNHSLDVIENDNIFKFSPYNTLTGEQNAVSIAIINDILDSFENGASGVSLVDGCAGTGKTVLAISIINSLINAINIEDDLLEAQASEFDDDIDEDKKIALLRLKKYIQKERNAMDSSLNSAKNNRLPNWNDFFIRFAKNQYIMYEMIHEREGIRKLYEACYRDNLHSIWANQELYRKGNSDTEFYGILEKNMRPVYDSARRQGYDVWERRLAV